MKYSYYFKSDSGDSMHIISENHYKTAAEFMKNDFKENTKHGKTKNMKTMKFHMLNFHVEKLSRQCYD